MCERFSVAARFADVSKWSRKLGRRSSRNCSNSSGYCTPIPRTIYCGRCSVRCSVTRSDSRRWNASWLIKRHRNRTGNILTRHLRNRSNDSPIANRLGLATAKNTNSSCTAPPGLLYNVVDARSGRGSTAFVTNVDFGDWTEYLGGPPLVMTLLDRVVDGAIVIRFDGKSYRQHRAEQNQIT